MVKKLLCIVIASSMIAVLLAADVFGDEYKYEDYSEPQEVFTVRIDGELMKRKEYSTCTISFEDAEGVVLYTDACAEWRTRGHSTAGVEKKPYTFKLSEQKALFGMEKARKWILLANAFDPTLLRNSLALDLASRLRFDYTPEYRYVELYVNGVYVGNYLLTEEAGIDGNRLDLHMSEDEFLLEIINLKRCAVDDVIVSTQRFRLNFKIRDAVYIPKSQMRRLTSFLNEAEDIIAGGDYNSISQVMDIDSFVDAYILNEFAKPADLDYASTRFYVKGWKLYAGPVWDYDLSMGNDVPGEAHKLNVYPEGWSARKLWWASLMQNDWFRDAVEKRYLELQPYIVNLYESNSLGEDRIDEILSKTQGSMDHNFTVWEISQKSYRYMRQPDENYEENLKYLRGWLEDRNEWLLNQIRGG